MIASQLTAAANGAVVAGAFTAFLQAAAVAGGKTCFASLLNVNPANQLACNVHASITCQRLLAKTAHAAYCVARRSDD